MQIAGVSLKKLKEATGYLSEDVPDGFVGRGSGGGERGKGEDYSEAGEKLEEPKIKQYSTL